MLKTNGWREQHYSVLWNFLMHLNRHSNKYVLKGGTALMMCYNLTRFSEDIDLNGYSRDIENIVSTFCIQNRITYTVKKDTDTVKKYMINYGGTKAVKVEVSYRLKSIDVEAETCRINGILVYNIQNILMMKLQAYMGRDKIRDLYDVVFIGLNYWELLNQQLIYMMKTTLAYRGLEQFDFVIKDQEDELINNEELEEGFLSLWYKLKL